MWYMIWKLCLIILLIESCPQNGEFSVGSAQEAELDRYTAEISHCEQFCDTRFLFWIRQNSFTILAPVALDLVAAPASQAYVKRVFSVCGDMCAGNRNRMKITGTWKAETTCFSASKQEILGRCRPAAVGYGYWNVLHSSMSSSASFYVHF